MQSNAMNRREMVVVVRELMRALMYLCAISSDFKPSILWRQMDIVPLLPCSLRLVPM